MALFTRNPNFVLIHLTVIYTQYIDICQRVITICCGCLSCEGYPVAVFIAFRLKKL